MSEPVSYEMVGDVAVVRIDDGKANALSHAVLDQLTAAVERSASEAKALLIVGREGKFSAGFDLSVMTAGMDQASELLAKGGRLGLKLYMHPIPVVFAVTGHALAMGGILLTIPDYRVGAQGGFKLGLNEVAIGMPVPRFAVELCRDRLDPSWFVRCVQSAEIVGPDDAVAAGFLDEVVAADAVYDRALEVATQRAATVHPVPFAKTRVAMREAMVDRLHAGMERDSGEFVVEAP